MTRAFWQHKMSGDVYAVELNDDGTARSAVGPIYYQEVTQEYLDDAPFGDGGEDDGTAMDAAWLNDQPCKIVEPTEYFAGDEAAR